MKELNHVMKLKNNDGELVTVMRRCQIVKDYFLKLSDKGVREKEMEVEAGHSVFSDEQNNELLADFSFQELTLLEIARFLNFFKIEFGKEFRGGV